MDLDEMFKDSDKRKQFNSFCESTNSLQSTFSIDENIDIKQVVNSLNKTNRELAEENLILKDEILLFNFNSLKWLGLLVIELDIP